MLVLIGALFFRGGAKPKYFAQAEYWVYLPGDKLPKQDDIMDRMLRANPCPGAIGQQEALVFSDIRLHIAMVQKARNPHVFRPDLFADDLEPSAEILQGLSQADSFAKVRFISEEQLPDKRHIQFVAHAAGAIVALGDGIVVYDPVAEKLSTAEDFLAMLAENPDATRPEVQTRVIWKRHGEGGKAETRGLVKIGLRELATEDMDSDQQVLVREVMDELVHALWSNPELPEKSEVSVFEDRYLLEVKPVRKGPSKVTILKA